MNGIRRMGKACGMLLALAGGMFAAGSAFGALGSTVWRGTIDDFYDKEGNWSNGLPSGTEKEGQFQTTADFTVKFPSGGYEEASFSGFYANLSGKSILVDTVGTWWLKGAGTYPSNWQAFRVSGNDGSGHFFTIEAVKNTGGTPVMKFSDGQMRLTAYDVNGTGSTLEFLSGVFNTYDPSGTDVGSGVNTIKMTTARACGARSRVIFREGSSLRANDVEVNGGTSDSLVLFEGGTHEIKRSLSITTSNPNADSNPAHGHLRVTGGTLTVGVLLAVANRDKPSSTGLLEISGDGAVILTRNGGDALYIGNKASVTGTVSLADSAWLNVSGSAGVYIARNASSTGRLILTDNAKATFASQTYTGYAAGSRSEIDLSGDAVLELNNLFYNANADGSSAAIHVGGNARMTAISGFTLGNSGDSEVLVDGNGRLETKGNFWCGRTCGASRITIRDNAVWYLPDSNAGFYVSGSNANISRGVRIDLEGGTIDSTARPIVVSGTNSIVNLAGGAANFRNVIIGSSDAPCTDSTNIFTVAGGTHSSKESVTIGASGAAARFEFTGGTVATRYVKGVGNMSALLADGGTFAATESGWTVFSGFARAELGEEGLTVEVPEGKTVTVDQAFTDAPDASGAFVKAGSGVLTAAQASDHARTVVRTGRLELGEGVTRFGGTLEIAEGARVSVDVPAAEGAYAVLTLDAELSAAELNRVVPTVADAGFLYVFTQATEDDVATVTCTVSVNDGTGTEISESGTFDGPVTLKNSLTVTAGGVTATFNGAANIVSGTLVIDVPSGSKVAFNGPVSAAYAKVEKRGAGEVVFAKESPDFAGEWEMRKGVFAVADEGALGPEAAALTFVSDTLRGGGEGALTIGNPIRVNAGSDQARVVIDAPHDLTFTGGFNSTAGGLVKTGAGTLTFDLGAGTYALGTGNYNKGEGAVTTLPADGASPAATSTDRSAALQIIDGSVTVKGEGRDKTTVNQTQPTYLGTGSSLQSVSQVLTLDGVKYMQGGASRPLYVGYNVPVGKPASPVLSVTNSYVWANTITLGTTGGNANFADLRPVMAVTNAEVELQWALNIGSNNDRVHPILRIGAGGNVRQYRNGGSTEGIDFFRDVDVEIADGGVLSALSVGAVQGYVGMQIQSGAWGTVRVRNGGKLSTDIFTSKNTGATAAKHLDFIFDGGILAMLKGSVALQPVAFAQPECQGFTTTGDGMRLYIDGGATHVFATPFRGDGAVTKIGNGTLQLAAIADDGPVFRQDGATFVAEGEMDLGGTVQSFAALGGAGTVRNGTVKGAFYGKVGATADGVPTLGDGLTLDGVRVAVFADDPEAIVVGAKFPIAKGVGAAVPAGLVSRTADRRFGVEYSVADGTLYAELAPRPGIFMIVR